MENNKEEDKKPKKGAVPVEQIEASDADKAYDENGNFGQPTDDGKEAKSKENTNSSDADAAK